MLPKGGITAAARRPALASRPTTSRVRPAGSDSSSAPARRCRSPRARALSASSEVPCLEKRVGHTSVPPSTLKAWPVMPRASSLQR